MKLNRLVHRFIQATCATSGDGLYEGLEWVSVATVAYFLALFLLTLPLPAEHQPEASGLGEACEIILGGVSSRKDGSFLEMVAWMMRCREPRII